MKIKFFIKEILNNINIINIIKKYIKVKKYNNNYIALCPFHKEKNPSFYINKEKKFFYCFGCKIHGNVINFLNKYLHLNFIDVIKYLINKKNIINFNKNEYIKYKEKKNILNILNIFNIFFIKKLFKKKKIISFFKKRKIKKKIIKKFNIGYSSNNIKNFKYLFMKYQSSLLIKTGLIKKNFTNSNYYIFFKKRIIFPIKNIYGNIIGFGGRILNNNKKYPKYLNSNNSKIFNKKKELYGLYEAKKYIKKLGYIIIVEGYIDVLSLFQFGYKNTVSILGTNISKYHIEKIFKYSNKIIFILDGDKAGKIANINILNILIKYKLDNKLIKFVFLPNNYDPDNFIHKYGKKKFNFYINNAILLSNFLILEIIKNNNINTIEGIINIKLMSLQILKKIPNSLFKNQIILNLNKITKINILEIKKKKKSKNIINKLKLKLDEKLIILFIYKPFIIYNINNKYIKIIKKYFYKKNIFLIYLIKYIKKLNIKKKKKYNLFFFIKKFNLNIKIFFLYNFLKKKKKKFIKSEILEIIKKIKINIINKKINNIIHLCKVNNFYYKKYLFFLKKKKKILNII